MLAARLALEHGLAASLGGGTHHAHRDFGAGYTALNDLAVTAAVLRREGLARRVLIVDLDVHQVHVRVCKVNFTRTYGFSKIRFQNERV